MPPAPRAIVGWGQRRAPLIISTWQNYDTPLYKAGRPRLSFSHGLTLAHQHPGGYLDCHLVLSICCWTVVARQLSLHSLSSPLQLLQSNTTTAPGSQSLKNMTLASSFVMRFIRNEMAERVGTSYKEGRDEMARQQVFSLGL